MYLQVAGQLAWEFPLVLEIISLESFSVLLDQSESVGDVIGMQELTQVLYLCS